MILTSRPTEYNSLVACTEPQFITVTDVITLDRARVISLNAMDTDTRPDIVAGQSLYVLGDIRSVYERFYEYSAQQMNVVVVFGPQPCQMLVDAKSFRFTLDESAPVSQCLCAEEYMKILPEDIYRAALDRTIALPD